MSARRGTLPLVQLQWQTWAVLTVVLALAVSTALLLIGAWGQ